MAYQNNIVSDFQEISFPSTSTDHGDCMPLIEKQVAWRFTKIFRPSPRTLSRWLCQLGVCGLVFSMAIPCWAGGLYITEFGTTSQGTAGAGSAAKASDASIAWHNPAGMTRLSDNQIQASAGVLFGEVKFDQDSTTPVAGGNGGNAAEPAPILGLSYAHNFTNRLKGGFALGSIAGAGLDYGNSWAGRQQATKVKLITVTAAPSLAYQLLDWLSVGAQLQVSYGRLDPLKLKAPNPAQSSIKIDGDDFVVRYSMGTLIEFSERTRVGIKYQSKNEFKFGGDLKVSGGMLGGTQFSSDTTIRFPQMVEGSLYHEINDQFAVLATANWEDWSDFGNVPISTAMGTQKIPRNWRDTFKLAGGVHYRVTPLWLLQAGFAYDSRPVGETDRTADMPMDRQFRYAVGAQHQYSEALSLGMAFEYLDMGKARINNSTQLIGKYKRNDLFFISFNGNFKFL
jgi:long-chain fatty acid transport protein